MEKNLFSMMNRLSLNLRLNSCLSESVKANASVNRRTLSTKRGISKSNLYSKISPLGNPSIKLGPELDQWVTSGKTVSVSELQRIIRDLRKRKRFKQALEVSEWMGGKGVCTYTTSDHAVKLDLIGRVHGIDSAESYFNSMSDQDKNEKTYGALLNCYVRELNPDKSLSHMQKMKELGFASSPLSYNDLMCLYTKIGEHEKVPGLLTEMKDSGVSPDNFSYRICINAFGVKSDIEGMEKVLGDMECQSHIVMDWNTYTVVANFYIKAALTEKALAALEKSKEKMDKKDPDCYSHLISLYTSLGNKAEVMRLWELQKAECKRHLNKDYITMLGSLVKLDEFKAAEKLFKEWESSDNSYDLRVSNTLVFGYSHKGLAEKAEAMLEEISEKGHTLTPNSWGTVAAGYVQMKKMENATRCMKMALSLHVGNEGWRPNPQIIASILGWVGENCEAKEAEAFVGLLKIVIPMNRDMYHSLIKANVREGKGMDGLLRGMKADKMEENEETKKILSSKQDQAV